MECVWLRLGGKLGHGLWFGNFGAHVRGLANGEGKVGTLAQSGDLDILDMFRRPIGLYPL